MQQTLPTPCSDPASHPSDFLPTQQGGTNAALGEGPTPLSPGSAATGEVSIPFQCRWPMQGVQRPWGERNAVSGREAAVFILVHLLLTGLQDAEAEGKGGQGAY